MFNEYPYRNIEDLNLDYLQARVRNLEKIVEQFVALESVTFADPIQWNITTQYAKNTVVLDSQGDAFISIKPVPTGVYLNNGEYWLEIFNFMDYVKSFNANLTFNIEEDTNRATIAYSVGDWLLLDDVLYKVLVAIPADGLFEIGVNIEHFTVEDFIKAWINYANGLIVQYKNDIDASELAYRNQLAGDIANTTASLQAQLDAAIAGVTVDSEVINARIGADGVTYATLGDAIRTQISNLATIDELSEHDTAEISNIAAQFTKPLNLFTDFVRQNKSAGGYAYGATCKNAYDFVAVGGLLTYSSFVPCKPSTQYAMKKCGYRIVYFDEFKETISIESIGTTFAPNTFTTPAGCHYFGFMSQSYDADYLFDTNYIVEGDLSALDMYGKDFRFNGLTPDIEELLEVKYRFNTAFKFKNNLFNTETPISPEHKVYTPTYSYDTEHYATAAGDNTHAYFIPVTAGKQYTANSSLLWVMFFDVNKKAVGYVTGSASTITFTVPSGACYAGLNFQGRRELVLVVEGNTLPSYDNGNLSFAGDVELDSDINTPLTITGSPCFHLDGKHHVIDLGEHLTATYNAPYYEIPYTYDSNSRIYKVCVTQTLPVEQGNQLVSAGYNTTLWAHYNSDETLDFKLRPVTNATDLAATPDSFYYDGTTIYINITTPANEYVLADDHNDNMGLLIKDSYGSVRDLTIQYTNNNNIYIQGGRVELFNVRARFCNTSTAIVADGGVAVLTNCEAFKARTDGMDTIYNTDYADMYQYNCHCHYCYDDGSSHHHGNFFISGGEYDHNHKSGIGAPCYLSEGNISGAYIHDNDNYGIYAVNNPGDGNTEFTVSDCLFVGNNRNIYANYMDIISYNNVYGDTPPNPDYAAFGSITTY